MLKPIIYLSKNIGEYSRFYIEILPVVLHSIRTRKKKIQIINYTSFVYLLK